MKRRTFILTSVAAAGVVLLPLTSCQPASGASMPEMLSALTEKRTLREIGRAYLEQYPTEKNQLKDLLKNGDVQNDFIKGNIVVVKGWVLAVTEARQCALLTL